jgi:hypothetical protein
MPAPETPLDNAKPSKDDIGLRVVLPGKARATITTLPISESRQTASPYEFWAAQFGTLLNLSGDLFSKKMRTELILEPTTGAVEKIETELIKK